MARVEDSVNIECAVEKAFAYTIEAKSWPDWQSFILKAEQTSPGPCSIGTTYKGISRLLGLSMKWTGKVTEYESNSNWAKDINCGGMSIQEHVNYQPVDGSINFTIVYDINAGGLMKLFAPMLVRAMRKETKKSLGNLKGILESQT